MSTPITVFAPRRAAVSIRSVDASLRVWFMAPLAGGGAAAADVAARECASFGQLQLESGSDRIFFRLLRIRFPAQPAAVSSRSWPSRFLGGPRSLRGGGVFRTASLGAYLVGSRGRCARRVLAGSWARHTRRLSGDGCLGGMPGGVPLAGHGGLGAFGLYVVLGARTARCAGVRGHRTRRVLAALEVAVLGAFLNLGVCVRAGRCGWSWRSVLKRRRTGCAEERCPARCGLGPDRRAARRGRPSSVLLGGP